MTILADQTAMLQNNGLSATEAATVMTNVQALPCFSYSNAIWGLDTSSQSTSVIARIWGIVCFEAVALIDVFEPGHWARPIFASQQINPKP